MNFLGIGKHSSFYKIWTLVVFIFTILSAPFWPVIPNMAWNAPILVLIVVCTKYRRFNWVAGGGIALIVILLKGNQLYTQSHAIFQFGEHVTISAQVDSYFRKINHGYEGTVKITAINGQKLRYFEQGKIRLRSDTPFNVGDTISAKVKLKRITGWLNEAGFDKKNYYFSRGWLSSGSVNGDTTVLKHASSLKSHLVQQVSYQTSTLDNRGLIKALLFGVRDEIPKTTWLNLQWSGLGHLLAISGLHVGIAYFIGFLVGSIVLCGSKWLIWSPVIVGCLFAFTYSWLADFGLSTQRALVMCVFNALLLFSRIRVSVWVRWLSTLAVVLAIYPFSFMSAGFWLSFIAVAVLFYLIDFTINDPLWLKALKIQTALTVFMGPLSALFFQGVSLSGVLYNLIFVPWVSLVIVPSLFITCMVSALGFSFAVTMWQLIDWMFNPIILATQFSSYGWLPISNSSWLGLISLAVVAVVYRVLSRGFFLIFSIVVATNLGLSSVFKKQPDWRVDILDVGHGLAILIEQKGEVVLYDTGRAWVGGSVAESVILPVLIRRGVNQIEGLILSHQDSDHAGGKDVIASVLKPNWIRASEFSVNHLPCEDGQSWRWGGLDFNVLWPPQTVSRSFNPHSCVIRIFDRENGHNILLTGDVENVVEWLLVRNNPSALASDIIVVPHHGSGTSSNKQFVSTVQPEFAIASLAKNSRWNLPSEDVVFRYENVGARWFDTGESGQISIEFINHSKKISSMRNRQSVRWYRQMLRNGVE